MKASDLKTIWQVPKYLPYIQPTLTEEIIEEAEKKLGHKLPGKYIDILKIQNGGYIRFTIAEMAHSEIYGIGPYFPSITNCDWSEYEDSVSFKLEGLIPFDGDGHWNICFDYRSNKLNPQVTYIDTESDTETIIANNFDHYLDLLELDTEGQYIIETDLSLQDTIRAISQVAKIEFEDPDYFAEGYPIYRSKFKEAWVWISPNKVPAGFIRPNEERYEELKSEMETMSLRYPEVGENCLFISVSHETVKEELFNVLTSNLFRVRSFEGLII